MGPGKSTYKTIIRLFEVIELMSEGPITIYELAEKIGVTERSTYRYIDIIMDIGFEVVMDGKLYSIGSKRSPRFVSKLKNTNVCTHI